MLEPLQFDLDTYTGLQIKERLSYYVENSKLALKIHKTDKERAMSILMELKNHLDIEYKYYTKLRFEKVLSSFENDNHDVIAGQPNRYWTSRPYRPQFPRVETIPRRH